MVLVGTVVLVASVRNELNSHPPSSTWCSETTGAPDGALTDGTALTFSSPLLVLCPGAAYGSAPAGEYWPGAGGA